MKSNLSISRGSSRGGAVRAGIAGLLAAFAFFILKELFETPVLFVAAIAAIAIALLLAKKTAKHFHGGHTHAGDSPMDAVAVSVLVLANVLHPAVDGFSLYETFDEKGLVAGWIFLGGVAVHECFRQSALIAAFRDMGMRWYWVVATGVLGIASGVGMGLLGSHALHDHEAVIDILTIFAYAFIIGEFYAADHGIKRQQGWFVMLGLAVGTFLAVFAKAH